MDGTHDRGSYAPMQAQNGPSPPNDLTTAMAVGGGWFPPSGCYSLKILGLYLGKDAETIRRWVYEYDVPHIKPGDEIFVFVADLLAAIPRITPSKSPRKRGGRRKPKE